MTENPDRDFTNELTRNFLSEVMEKSDWTADKVGGSVVIEPDGEGWVKVEILVGASRLVFKADTVKNEDLEIL